MELGPGLIAALAPGGGSQAADTGKGPVAKGSRLAHAGAEHGTRRAVHMRVQQESLQLIGLEGSAQVIS